MNGKQGTQPAENKVIEMGNNYEIRIKPCKHCGLSKETIHVGKSSMGWRFSLHVQEEYYKDWDSFKNFLAQTNIEIVDENNKKWKKKDFIELIEEKKDGSTHLQYSTQYQKVVQDGPVDLCFYDFS